MKLRKRKTNFDLIRKMTVDEVVSLLDDPSDLFEYAYCTNDVACRYPDRESCKTCIKEWLTAEATEPLKL